MKKVTVIGIGRLGLSLALLFENKGLDVLGIDINQDYVDKLNTKTLKSNEPRIEELLKSSSNFVASTDLQKGLDFSDMIFIIVQTPNSGGHKFYDHSIVSNLLAKINKLKPKNKNFIIGCTVMPKYIDEVATLLVEDCPNCTVSYNPEFIAQGDIINGFLNPDILLLGTHSEYVKEQIKEIYNKIGKQEYRIMTPLEAEITKISINGYITTKISYANMLSDLCDELGADKKVVLNAIGSDKRIGTRYFNPGNSYGGPCFPRDTLALKQLLEQNLVYSDLLKATHLYNQIHTEIIVNSLLKQNLDEYVIQNLCYKDNCKVPIIEESANLKIAKLLVENGKKVILEDCEELILEAKKEYGNIFEYNII